MKTDFAKGAAWAIHPERFDEIARRYHETQITDELILKAEKEALVFNMGKSGDEAPYEITEDGTAIVKVAGPLMKSPDFFDRLFGAVGYEDIQRAVLAAIDDQRVNGIVLDIDSPGGTVNGADETAEMIFNARGQKPIVAFSSGMMASAAYMVGSAADKIVVGKNAELGSIGVLMIHTDYSKAMEKVGVKRTYLKAGRFKALGNPAEPLSDAAREVFQAELNHIYGNFIDTVALNRDVESEKVRADMADGRIFIGNQAVGVGLADEVGNLQTALAYASGDEISTRRQDEMKIETYEQLKAAAPEILKAAEDTARDDGVKSINFEGIQKEAADAAMAKVIGMAEVHFGAEAGAKFKSLVESGISVEQYKATVAAIGQPPAAASNVAEEEARKAALATLKESGAQNPGSGNPPTGGKDYMILVEEYSAAHKCSKTEAMYAINKSHPQARQDFINKDNPGLTVAK